jgi:hypothetical protein
MVAQDSSIRQPASTAIISGMREISMENLGVLRSLLCFLFQEDRCISIWNFGVCASQSGAYPFFRGGDVGLLAADLSLCESIKAALLQYAQSRDRAVQPAIKCTFYVFEEKIPSIITLFIET